MTQEVILKNPLVSVEWLNNHLDASNLIVLDATMNKINALKGDSINIQIPKARFFDIKNTYSNVSDPFPNAVPSENQFTKEAQNLGINQNNAIVVYDENGIYSSARVWWLFKAFGHNNVAVLNGGLPEWIKDKYSTEEKKENLFEKGNFVANYKPEYFKFLKDIRESLNDKSKLILDARSKDRFKGLVDEPREGLRSGNIPNSKNLPYTDLIHENKFKSKEELITLFNKLDDSNNDLIFSCGSGITACILALGADIAGRDKLTVYDGSWTEYGSLTNEDTMEISKQWSKNELVAYILLYASQSDLIVSNKERNVIISKVDMNTFQKIRNEFDNDNDYQSIQKIIAGLKEHNYTKMDIDLLLADIKMLFFADGRFNVSERSMYKLLTKLFQN